MSNDAGGMVLDTCDQQTRVRAAPNVAVSFSKRNALIRTADSPLCVALVASCRSGNSERKFKPLKGPS